MNHTTINHPTENRKVYENPVIGDKIVFLKTSEETKGEYTLIEIELAPKGGNSPHIHLHYTEKFTPLKGALTVHIRNERKILQPGESFTVPIRTPHYFENPTNQSVKFLVEIRPAQPGFENSLKIAYGLAKDGLTNKKSIPKNFSHLALLATTSGTFPVGIFSLITPFFQWAAKRARQQGVEKELIDRYCQ